MKVYAVLDTNIIVSAMLKKSSVPGRVLEYALRGVITPVLHEEIVNEYRTVLTRDKFHLTTSIVNDLIHTLEYYGEYIQPAPFDITLPDPKDFIFYALLLEKQKNALTYLVTGNLKHFPIEPFILTPRQFINILDN